MHSFGVNIIISCNITFPRSFCAVSSLPFQPMERLNHVTGISIFDESMWRKLVWHRVEALSTFLHRVGRTTMFVLCHVFANWSCDLGYITGCSVFGRFRQRWAALRAVDFALTGPLMLYSLLYTALLSILLLDRPKSDVPIKMTDPIKIMSQPDCINPACLL